MVEKFAEALDGDDGDLEVLGDARDHEERAHVEAAREKAMDDGGDLMPRKRVAEHGHECGLRGILVGFGLGQEKNALGPEGLGDAARLVTILRASRECGLKR